MLRAEPDPASPLRLVMQTILSQPALADLDIDRITLLDWLNAKNSDLLFGRYYNYEDLLIFEIALPVFDNTCDWKGFDHFLHLALFSFEDALAQLKAAAAELSE